MLVFRPYMWMKYLCNSCILQQWRLKPICPQTWTSSTYTVVLHQSRRGTGSIYRIQWKVNKSLQGASCRYLKWYYEYLDVYIFLSCRFFVHPPTKSYHSYRICPLRTMTNKSNKTPHNISAVFHMTVKTSCETYRQQSQDKNRFITLICFTGVQRLTSPHQNSPSSATERQSFRSSGLTVSHSGDLQDNGMCQHISVSLAVRQDRVIFTDRSSLHSTLLCPMGSTNEPASPLSPGVASGQKWVTVHTKSSANLYDLITACQANGQMDRSFTSFTPVMV